MSKDQLSFSGQLSGCFAPLPLGGLVAGLTGTARAAWPVWRDSTRKEVKFQPLPKKKAVRLYHEARKFERQTRAAMPQGYQDGVLGRNGLKVLETLIFDFLNFASGRLDPAIETIAKAAGISVSSAKRGLVKLKESGVVNWLRRCAEDWKDGRFVLKQETNAYAILPASQWRGYTPEPEAPPPQSGTWGDHPPLPDAFDQIVQDGAATHAARVSILEQHAPQDELARSLARLGRAVAEKRAKLIAQFGSLGATITAKG
jgi:hypothetical protein